MKPEIVLDVPYEDTLTILSDRGWKVTTVTKKFGSTKEDREDGNILKHAQDDKFIVVTDDKKFVRRLKGAGIESFRIETEDRADIIDMKLKNLEKA